MEERKFTERPVMISDGTRLLSINLKEVCYFKADGNYTEMYFVNQKKPIVLTRRVGELEKVLPRTCFVRISRSAIINIWYVRMVMGRLITLKNGMEMKLGKCYADVLADRFLVLEERRN